MPPHAQLDRWMHGFVKQHGLAETFAQQPSADYERFALKDEIQLQTTQVQGLVRRELEHGKRVQEAGQDVAREMAAVGERAEGVVTYTGKSASTRMRNETALERQCEKVTSEMAASLAEEYQAAWLEGRRELQCDLIVQQQAELKERFQEDVDVDLASALLASSSMSDRTERTHAAIATMDRVGSTLRALAPQRDAESAEGDEAAAAAQAEGGEGEEAGEGGGSHRWKFHQRQRVLRAAVGATAGEQKAAAPSPAAQWAVPTPPPPLSANDLHSGRSHLARTPEGARVPGLWPRPRSRPMPAAIQPPSPRADLKPGESLGGASFPWEGSLVYGQETAWHTAAPAAAVYAVGSSVGRALPMPPAFRSSASEGAPSARRVPSFHSGHWVPPWNAGGGSHGEVLPPLPPISYAEAMAPRAAAPLEKDQATRQEERDRLGVLRTSMASQSSADGLGSIDGLGDASGRPITPYRISLSRGSVGSNKTPPRSPMRSRPGTNPPAHPAGQPAAPPGTHPQEEPEILQIDHPRTRAFAPAAAEGRATLPGSVGGDADGESSAGPSGACGSPPGSRGSSFGGRRISNSPFIAPYDANALVLQGKPDGPNAIPE